jgi:hypothetical protein
LKTRSSASWSVRTRGRDVAIDIHKVLGPEVLLLVIIVAKSLVKMAALNQEEGLIRKLSDWWTAVSHPTSLTQAASVWKVVPSSKTNI